MKTFPDNQLTIAATADVGYDQVVDVVPPLLTQEIARSVWHVLKKSGINP
jgi:hypothetical protein